MNTIPSTDYDITDASARREFRDRLSIALSQWRASGSPRDAVSIEQVEAASNSLKLQASYTTSTAEDELLRFSTDAIARAIEDLSNGDKATTDAHPTIVVGEPAEPVNQHADCLDTIQRLRVEIRQLRTEDIEASDSRLSTMWEKAGEIADRRGYCSVYDELAEELGAPTRTVDGVATITVTRTQTITIALDFEGVSPSALESNWRDALENEFDSYTIAEYANDGEVEDESVEWEIRSYERS